MKVIFKNLIMRTLIIICVIFFSKNIFAQKGTFLVGGNVNYTYNKIKTANQESLSRSFEFAPVVGYQFSKNMTAGVKSLFAYSKDENSDVISSNRIGGFIRYAKSLDKKGMFAIYGDLEAGYKTNKTNYAISDTDVIFEGGYAEFIPAIFINLKNGFGLNFNIGGISYEHLENKGTNIENNINNFSIDFGKTLSIGISKNF